MRLADGPTHEESIEIDASPLAVWPIVIDLDGLAARSDEFQGGEWLEEPALGSRFVGRNHHPKYDFKWKTTSVVVEFSPGEVFSWAVGDPENAAAQWWFTIRPSEGGCDVTQKVRLGPGPSGLSAAIDGRPDKEEKIIANRLEALGANMRSTLQGVKERAES